jgi:hypothetical protein
MKALDILKDQKLKQLREQYPSLPEYAIKKPKYTDKTANGLTKCIIDYLILNGCQAERINTAGRVIDERKHVTNVVGITKVIGSMKYIPTTGTKGSADISATIKGRSVKIEVKIGKDRQSDHQKRYQEMIERAGGVYIIAKDFQWFYDWFKEFTQTV